MRYLALVAYWEAADDASAANVWSKVFGTLAKAQRAAGLVAAARRRQEGMVADAHVYPGDWDEWGEWQDVPEADWWLDYDGEWMQ